MANSSQNLAVSLCFLTFVGISGWQVESVKAQNANAEFWQAATPIIKSQINLVEPLAIASRTQDAAVIRNTRNLLILHMGQVERFLRRYPVAGVCPTSSLNRAFSVDTNAFAKLASGELTPSEAYCNLKQTREQLLPIFQTLAIRSQVLQGESGEVLKPVPLVDGREPPFDPYKQWAWQAGKSDHERDLAKLRLQSRPVLELPKNSRLEPHKTAVGNYAPRLAAIFPASSNAQDFIEKSAVIAQRSALRQEPYIPRNPLHIYDQKLDYAKYKDFLAQFRGTGFAQINPNGLAASLPSSSVARLSNPYLTDPRSLFNYEQALVIQRIKNPDEPQIRESPLMLELDQGQLIVQGQGLDYGFMQDVGDIPLDEVAVSAEQVPTDVAPELWAYFWRYQPPTQVADLQAEQRLYATEKLSIAGIPIVSQLPVQVDRTYLMRTISYELPEVVRSPRLYVSRNFPYVEVLNSSDLLVAFRPIRQRDGSYTVLWRILARFPSPKITDLERYVQIR